LINKMNDDKPVARMKQSGIREEWCHATPDSVSLHPGYNTDYTRRKNN